MNAQRLILLEGDVPQHVLRLAVPLAGGMLAIRLFSLVDAWFVSHLGTVQLAALGFTIPIVMLYMGVIFGINVGTSTALSRVYGEGDMPRFKRMATRCDCAVRHSGDGGFCHRLCADRAGFPFAGRGR